MIGIFGGGQVWKLPANSLAEVGAIKMVRIVRVGPNNLVRGSARRVPEIYSYKNNLTKPHVVCNLQGGESHCGSNPHP